MSVNSIQGMKSSSYEGRDTERDGEEETVSTQRT